MKEERLICMVMKIRKLILGVALLSFSFRLVYKSCKTKKEGGIMKIFHFLKKS